MTFRDLSIWVGCLLAALAANLAYLKGCETAVREAIARIDTVQRNGEALADELVRSVAELGDAATRYLETGDTAARQRFLTLRARRDNATTGLGSPFAVRLAEADLSGGERERLQAAWSAASLLSTRQFASIEIVQGLDLPADPGERKERLARQFADLSILHRDLFKEVASFHMALARRTGAVRQEAKRRLDDLSATLAIVFGGIQAGFVISLAYFAWVVLPGFERIRLALRVTVEEETDAPVYGVCRRDEVGDMARAVVTLREQSRNRLDRLYRLAYFDALTGLANRSKFRTRLRELVGQDFRGGHLAVFMVDLDKFKEINDIYGHPAGDVVLAKAARRLEETFGGALLVCRFGGDEFAAVGIVDTIAEAVALGERAIARLGLPITIGNGALVTCGGTIGLATTDSRIPVDRMISRADVALYSAKEAGRGRIQQFVPGMDARIAERRGLEEDLRNAGRQGQLRLALQPQFALRGGHVVGFEALMRWHHPERGDVSPADFIPIAEESRLIIDIGRWSIWEACRLAAAWPVPVRISVNLSPAQFYDKGLVPYIADTLRDAGIAARRVEIEITESVLIDDRAAAFRVMHELRGLGVHLALDDFGTGFSSLSYLREFPFDKIKIDQSFVRALEGEGTARAIIRSMIGLGKALGMTVIAEGVETPEQRAMLLEDGCDEVQGYLTGRAMSPDSALDLLRARHDSAIAAFEQDAEADRPAAWHLAQEPRARTESGSAA